MTDINSPLDEFEQETMAELGNLSLGAGAVNLSMILNKPVTISMPRVTQVPADEFYAAQSEPSVLVELRYVIGDEHPQLFLLGRTDALTVCELMTGGSLAVVDGEIGEMQTNALGEAFNQMMLAAATNMSTFFSRRVSVTPAVVNYGVPSSSQMLRTTTGADLLTLVTFTLVVEGVVNSTLTQVLKSASARKLVESLVMAADNPDAVAAAVAEETTRQEPAQGRSTGAVAESRVAQDSGARRSAGFANPVAPMAEQVPVRAAQFAPLAPPTGLEGISGLDLILDVPLRVTVELGRTRMPIRDVLDLGKGSVVELDKLAGEPVDMLVNGKLIARGEVVVIDENFGIRVTDIANPIDRVSNLKMS